MSSGNETTDLIDANQLALSGIFDYRRLEAAAAVAPKYLIEGLIHEESLNVMIGNSGLGKTPLAAMIAMRIAAGLPVFGRRVKRGPTLYLDAETAQAVFKDTLDALARHAGLSAVPDNFYVWSPNWVQMTRTPGEVVPDLVRRVKPVFVVVDPLRIFWPQMERRSDDAIAVINQLRALSKEIGIAWVVMHHRRKSQPNYQVYLEDDPYAWFEEAAGSHAIVNHSDTRLGIEPARIQSADLVMTGFARSLGRVPPIYLSREFDDEGLPLGYKFLTGLDYLGEADKAAYNKLPSAFRFGDVRKALGGNSDSNTTRFLELCRSINALHKDGSTYKKIME